MDDDLDSEMIKRLSKIKFPTPEEMEKQAEERKKKSREVANEKGILIFDSINQLICKEHEGSKFIRFNLDNSEENYFCEECLKTDKEITEFYYKCTWCDGYILGNPTPKGEVRLITAKNGLYKDCFNNKHEDYIARIPDYNGKIPECIICEDPIGFWMPITRCTKYDHPRRY